jgi:nucleotide-binding universal stress UspA family protein
MPGPVLFCYDGSEGSRAAMAAAAELVAHPAPAVVLTIWQPAWVLLTRAGGFGGGYLNDEGKVDGEQAQFASDAAEEGVERARDHGYDASSRVEEATGDAGRRILEIADELDARLIVCGRRGLGAVASALLGSVSHVVLAHAGRPVLIAPER